MSVPREKILELHKAHVARYGAADAVRATLTEVHALLQLESPPPYTDHPPHIPKEDGVKLSWAQIDEVHAHQRAQVSDAHRLAADKARAKEPFILDGHHFAQREHQRAQWDETYKAVRDAGIGEGSAS